MDFVFRLCRGTGEAPLHTSIPSIAAGDDPPVDEDIQCLFQGVEPDPGTRANPAGRVPTLGRLAEERDHAVTDAVCLGAASRRDRRRESAFSVSRPLGGGRSGSGRRNAAGTSAGTKSGACKSS